MSVQTGIDVCIEDRFKKFKGKRVGLLIHPASVDSKLRYTQDLFLQNVGNRHARSLPNRPHKKLNVKALFTPEHGLYGTQEYMKGVESFRDSRSGLPVYSLYGETLKPTSKMLEEIDTMVIDLQDVGTRYYTFIWTTALTLRACAQNNKQVVILDRPNPINGTTLEGPVLSPNFSSFVGLYPIPVRHSMTIGELARMFNLHFKIRAELEIIKMQGWHRKMWFDETGLPWVMPSPNMATFETAIVYPGMCLLEGTNISEARGTTRPFELFGAPWIDERKLCQELNKENLPGVVFRPVHFIPYTSKFKEKLCKGAQLHITQRIQFEPFLTGVHIIKVIKNMYPKFFEWRKPPYEYEHKKLPFDLLAGNSWLRKFIEQDKPLKEMQSRWGKELETFKSIREEYLLY